MKNDLSNKKLKCRIRGFIHTISAFLLIAGLSNSCECVPGLDTPKEYIPSAYTKTAIINNFSNVSEFSFKTSGMELTESFSVSSTNESYKKIPAGLSSFIFTSQNDNEVFYRSNMQLSENFNYTMICHGTKSRPQVLLLPDTNYNFKSNNFNLRIVNLSSNHSSLKLILKEQNDTISSLNYLAYTSIMHIAKAAATIQITDNSSSTVFETSTNISLESNVLNILILNDQFAGGLETRLVKVRE